MPKVRPLTPTEARATLANRLGPTVDRIRQIATNLGVRPYRVFLVWTRWSGSERGEGNEQEVLRVEVLPTPRVTSLDNVSFSPMHAGVLPVGSLRVDRISVATLPSCFPTTYDLLRGHMVPTPHEDQTPEPFEFFYEVIEDGRGDCPPVRAKYRLLSVPFRRAGKVDWTVTLERESQDNFRDGASSIGSGKEG